MFKLTPRTTLWAAAVWTAYSVVGVVLALTDSLSHGNIVCAQVFLYGSLSLPDYNKHIGAWLNRPRVEVLRICGRLFTA